MKGIFIDASATREFFLSLDSERSVKWTLGALDSRIVLHIIAKTLGSDSSAPEKFFFQLVDFVRFGLRDVEGLTDHNDLPVQIYFEEIDIPYIGKRRVVADKFLERLPAHILVEIGSAIKDDNVLTDDSRKKSYGLSQSSETRD